MKILILLTILFVFFEEDNAFSYPQFIGFGYNSCSSCHYNPYGNGPLTDYGRALSATEVASRIIFSKDKTEEDIGEESGFLYQKPFNSWFRPSLDYRGMKLKRHVGKDDSETKNVVMQADISGTFKLNGTDKYFLTATYGYAPIPDSKDGEDHPEYRSREHYLGIRPNSNIGVYIGMMDKTFGIRVADHIAFSRTVTRLAHNDQTHGVLFNLNYADFELGLHPFAGNLSVDKEERQVGFSSKLEYSISNTSKPGFSFLQSESDFVKLQHHSLHWKQGLSKGSSLMLEVGKANKEEIELSKKTTSTFAMMQNHIMLDRGLFTFFSVEYLKPSQDMDTKVYRLGPGIQYFPVQGLELRMDVYNTKTYTSQAAISDSWDIAGQVHLWL